MSVIIGIISFFYAAKYCFYAFEYYRLLKKGIRTTATVKNIERFVDYDGDDNEVISYRLHLELPEFNGWKLGKIYEKSINPAKYTIGDTIEIIHNPDKPTELVVVKELTTLENPKLLLGLSVLLYIVSYVSCYIIR